MNVFEFEPVYQSVVEKKRERYIFYYCIMDALHVFPQELVLYILDMRMHYVINLM